MEVEMKLEYVIAVTFMGGTLYMGYQVIFKQLQAMKADWKHDLSELKSDFRREIELALKVVMKQREEP